MVDLTFVTVGKLAGKTVNLGQGGRYQFVDGEMQCPEEVFGLVSTALRFYSAFPKGDAMRFHEAACKKLGIDPDTLPLGKPEAKPDPASTGPTPAQKAAQKAAAVKLTKQQLLDFVDAMDPEDDNQWNSAGKASLDYVRRNFDGEESSYLTRKTLDATGVVRVLDEKS